MAAEQTDGGLPLLLIHRSPSFNRPTLTRLLRRHFRLVDPTTTANLCTTSSPSKRAPHSPPSVSAFDHLLLLPPLKLVAAATTGTNHIDVAACRRRGVAVTNAGDAFTADSADYAVALLVDVLWRVSAGDPYVRSGLWPV